MLKPILIAFDFDETIVAEDTDDVVRDLIPGKLPESVEKLWNIRIGHIPYMREIFKILSMNGTNEENIKKAINRIAPIPGIEDLMKNLYSHNCEVIILSDANIFSIETWLENRNLRHTVSRVFSNPAWFDENGLLNIENYHDQDWCKLSAPNLCKGDIFEKYINQREKEGVTFGKICYAGDGQNDFCPMLRLSERDIIFPRMNSPIMETLNNKSNKLVPKAEVLPWTSGIDIWEAISTRSSFKT